MLVALQQQLHRGREGDSPLRASDAASSRRIVRRLRSSTQLQLVSNGGASEGGGGGGRNERSDEHSIFLSLLLRLTDRPTEQLFVRRSYAKRERGLRSGRDRAFSVAPHAVPKKGHSDEKKERLRGEGAIELGTGEESRPNTLSAIKFLSPAAGIEPACLARSLARRLRGNASLDFH